MALTNHEKNVIEGFLAKYNEYHSSSFVITSCPDELDRSGRAIDAIAVEGSVSLGIEHTLLQPFSGEKQDSHIFMETVGQLDEKSTLTVPNYDVDLVFQVGAIPKGFDWSMVAPAVESWYQSVMQLLPLGRSTHKIPGLPIDLPVTIVKDDSPGPGHFFVQRSMPLDTVEQVVREALKAKIGKLLAAPVNRRVLLLEKDSLPRGYGKIGQAVEALIGEFSELNKKIDEVWVINTVALQSEGYAPSYLVWPPKQVALFTNWRHAV